MPESLRIAGLPSPLALVSFLDVQSIHTSLPESRINQAVFLKFRTKLNWEQCKMVQKQKFRAVIENAGGGGAFVSVPFDVEQVFGKKRVKIKATSFRTLIKESMCVGLNRRNESSRAKFLTCLTRT